MPKFLLILSDGTEVARLTKQPKEGKYQKINGEKIWIKNFVGTEFVERGCTCDFDCDHGIYEEIYEVEYCRLECL